MIAYRSIYRFLFCLLVLLLATAAALAQSTASCMVLDLKGSLRQNQEAVGILQTLASGKTYSLAKDSKLKLGLTGTARQWQLEGPLVFKASGNGPIKSQGSGSLKEVQRTSAPALAPVKGVNLQKMGGVRRSRIWITSDPGQLSTTPTLTWSSWGHFDQFQLSVQDLKGKKLYQAELPAGSKTVKLPLSAGLKLDNTYFIRLQAQQGARRYGCSGHLSLLPKAQAKATEKIVQSYRKAYNKTNDLSYLSLSVLELAEQELFSKAKPIIEEMAKLRPNDPNLSALQERLSGQSRP